MKTGQPAIVGVVLGLLMAANAMAQDAPQMTMPWSVRQTAYGDDYYVGSQNGPSTPPVDKAAPPAPTDKDKAAAASDKDKDKDKAADAKTDEKADEEKKPDEPHRVIGKLGCTDINIYGWLDMGGTINGDHPASRYNGTLAPNDRNLFQFNQNYLVFEKTLDTKKNGWDVGGRLDLLYGSDYIFCESVGFETRPDGSPKWNGGIDYGLAMPQAYGEIGYGDVSMKLGRFYTIIGYEGMMATGNFFYSMNYAVRYAEPTTHTGGLATWKKNDEWTFYLGGVNGQDQTDGLTDSLAVLTGFAWTPKDKKYSLNFGIMTGGLEPRTADTTLVDFTPRTYFSTYLTYNFTDKFQSVTQWDAGWQQNYDLLGDTADFWSFTQYFFYTINEKWKAGLRYDMFVDGEGTRLGGLRFGGLPGGNPLPLPSGDAGTVQAITAGLNYTYNANLRIRPEIRWDWYGGSGPKLFDDNTKNSQFTASVDAILQF
jgi:hypothetical protein